MKTLPYITDGEGPGSPLEHGWGYKAQFAGRDVYLAPLGDNKLYLSGHSSDWGQLAAAFFSRQADGTYQLERQTDRVSLFTGLSDETEISGSTLTDEVLEDFIATWANEHPELIQAAHEVHLENMAEVISQELSSVERQAATLRDRLAEINRERGIGPALSGFDH